MLVDAEYSASHLGVKPGNYAVFVGQRYRKWG